MSAIGRVATPEAMAASRQRRGDAQDQAGIERIGDQRARPEGRRFAAIGARRHLRGRLARQRRDGVDRRDLHGLVDLGGADIERAAEDIGKAQDVVHLVGEVRASGADQGVGRALSASSGMISGVGLASAMISGRGAIRAAISGLSTPGADRPRKISAPSITSASFRLSVFWA